MSRDSDERATTVRLSELPIGTEGRVVRLGARDPRRADRLSGLGVAPGSIVVVLQRRPAFVVEVGETTLALGEEIADEVLVVPC